MHYPECIWVFILINYSIYSLQVFSGDLGASELLLEMMVKIAAHPDQWEQVHNLLRKSEPNTKRKHFAPLRFASPEFSRQSTPQIVYVC